MLFHMYRSYHSMYHAAQGEGAILPMEAAKHERGLAVSCLPASLARCLKPHQQRLGVAGPWLAGRGLAVAVAAGCGGPALPSHGGLASRLRRRTPPVVRLRPWRSLSLSGSGQLPLWAVHG